MSTATMPTLNQLMARTTAGPRGCVIWTGPVSKQGAPAVYLSGKRRQARRLAYELCVGVIPEKHLVAHAAADDVPDELVRLCINPRHAELVDGKAHGRKHCPQGHPYEGWNVLLGAKGEHRGCRTCKGIRDADQWKKEKASRPPRPARPAPSPKAGERLAALYGAYHSRITGLLVHEVRGSDRHLAEDLTQEVFLSAWLDLDRLEATSEKQTFAWLTTIARRTAIHHYRVKRNVSEVPADTGDWQFANRSLAPAGGYYTPASSGFRTARIGSPA
ncbi:RNA polymerase sigma factor [Streptomyces sp. NPDC057575]|uniref:RNA polymerase sigma factor n=1 Tax=unclassified Streptomyces TaxID=2593676 RepID=UPI003674DBD0